MLLDDTFDFEMIECDMCFVQHVGFHGKTISFYNSIKDRNWLICVVTERVEVEETYFLLVISAS